MNKIVEIPNMEAVKKAKTLRDLLKTDYVKQRAEEVLGDNSQSFTLSVLSLANDPNINQIDPTSTFNACLTAAAINLPVDKNLGFAHIIPYKGKAQLQVGWKGYVQLALRSGDFKQIGANEVHEGDYKGLNPMTGEPEFSFSDNNANKPVIGYMAYFSLNNGFFKAMYMPISKIKLHAMKYSQSYQRGGGVWAENFEAMAKKTVLKLLINKYAPMTPSLARAVEIDQSADGKYVDNHKDFNEQGLKIEKRKIIMDKKEQ